MRIIKESNETLKTVYLVGASGSGKIYLLEKILDRILEREAQLFIFSLKYCLEKYSTLDSFERIDFGSDLTKYARELALKNILFESSPQDLETYDEQNKEFKNNCEKIKKSLADYGLAKNKVFVFNEDYTVPYSDNLKEICERKIIVSNKAPEKLKDGECILQIKISMSGKYICWFCKNSFNNTGSFINLENFLFKEGVS